MFIVFINTLKMSTITLTYNHHGLRGSASAELMATGLVNGKGQILTPIQNRYPLTDLSHRWWCWKIDERWERVTVILSSQITIGFPYLLQFAATLFTLVISTLALSSSVFHFLIFQSCVVSVP